MSPERTHRGLVIAAAALTVLGIGGGATWVAMSQTDTTASAARALQPDPEAQPDKVEPSGDEGKTTGAVNKEIAADPQAAVDIQAAATAEATRAAESVVLSVRVESEPEGAEVYRDGKRLGETPLTVELPAGAEQELELKRRGYRTARLKLPEAANESGLARVELERVRRSKQTSSVSADAETVKKPSEPKRKPRTEKKKETPARNEVLDW